MRNHQVRPDAGALPERGTGPCPLCGECRGERILVRTRTADPDDGCATGAGVEYCGRCVPRVLTVLLLHAFAGPGRECVEDWTVIALGAAGPDGGGKRRRVRFRCGGCGEAGLELGDLEPVAEPHGEGWIGHRRKTPDGPELCGRIAAVPPWRDEEPPNPDEAVFDCSRCGAAGVESQLARPAADETGDLLLADRYHHRADARNRRDDCGPLWPTGTREEPRRYAAVLEKRYGKASAETHRRHVEAIRAWRRTMGEMRKADRAEAPPAREAAAGGACEARG